MHSPQLSRLPVPPSPTFARLATAAALRCASRALGRLASRLALVRASEPQADPVYEFYAEAGAPEGAVYVDGQLIGHVPGVTRL